MTASAVVLVAAFGLGLTVLILRAIKLEGATDAEDQNIVEVKRYGPGDSFSIDEMELRARNIPHLFRSQGRGGSLMLLVPSEYAQAAREALAIPGAGRAT